MLFSYWWSASMPAVKKDCYIISHACILDCFLLNVTDRQTQTTNSSQPTMIPNLNRKPTKLHSYILCVGTFTLQGESHLSSLLVIMTNVWCEVKRLVWRVHFNLWHKAFINHRINSSNVPHHPNHHHVYLCLICLMWQDMIKQMFNLHSLINELGN